VSNYIVNEKKITKFLEIVIHIGNFLNAGNKRLGQCNAFEFETFAVLHSTKTSDNKQTMFEMITEMIKKQTPEVVSFHPAEHELLKAAVRVSLPTIEADLKNIRKNFDKVLKSAPNVSGDQFQSAFIAFEKKATPMILELEASFEEANTAYKFSVEQYGEDPSKKEPGEFFGVFEGFIGKIIDVVTKIDVAREKEEKLKQRELAKQKATTTRGGTKPTTGATQTTRGGSTPTSTTSRGGSQTAATTTGGRGGSATGGRGGRGGSRGGGDDKVVENMFNALEGGNIFKQNRRGGNM